MYSWKDKIDKENEVLMVLKSRSALGEKIMEVVKKNHPYELPELI